MAETRTSFYQLVKQTIEAEKTAYLTSCNDKPFESKLIKQCKDKIMTGYANRAFDSFQVLIDTDHLKTIHDNYLTIFNNIRSRLDKLDETEKIDVCQLTEDEKSDIKQWKNLIITIAIQDMIDETGEVKQEIKELLEWHELDINTCNILCAFVGGVNQIISHDQATIEKLTESLETFTAFCRYENANTRTWVQEALKATGFDCPDEKNISNEIIESPRMQLVKGLKKFSQFALNKLSPKTNRFKETSETPQSKHFMKNH